MWVKQLFSNNIWRIILKYLNTDLECIINFYHKFYIFSKIFVLYYEVCVSQFVKKYFYLKVI